jgi:hypothetical protein
MPDLRQDGPYRAVGSGWGCSVSALPLFVVVSRVAWPVACLRFSSVLGRGPFHPRKDSSADGHPLPARRETRLDGRGQARLARGTPQTGRTRLGVIRRWRSAEASRCPTRSLPTLTARSARWPLFREWNLAHLTANPSGAFVFCFRLSTARASICGCSSRWHGGCAT